MNLKIGNHLIVQFQKYDYLQLMQHVKIPIKSCDNNYVYFNAILTGYAYREEERDNNETDTNVFIKVPYARVYRVLLVDMYGSEETTYSNDIPIMLENEYWINNHNVYVPPMTVSPKSIESYTSNNDNASANVNPKKNIFKNVRNRIAYRTFVWRLRLKYPEISEEEIKRILTLHNVMTDDI